MTKVFAVAAMVAALAATACQRQANEDATAPATTSPDVAAPGDMSNTTTTPDATAPNATAAAPALDVAAPQSFVSRVAMSDRLEVETSRAALQKTQNAEVRRFAEMMVADHGKTTQELTKLSQTAGLTIPTDLDADTQSKIANIQSAEAEGFDDKYLDTIIDGHEAAIRDFETYSNQGQNAELKAWATKTLPTLRTHLQRAEAIRKTVNRS